MKRRSIDNSEHLLLQPNDRTLSSQRKKEIMEEKKEIFNDVSERNINFNED